MSSKTASDPDISYREAVGRTLHRLRTDRGWTLRALHERSGLSVAFLSEIERGLKEPSGAVLGQLAGAFGLSLADLLAAVARALNESVSPFAVVPERLPPDLRAALTELDDAELAELARYAAYLQWRKESLPE